MASLSDSEKLRVRLAHWTEHNVEHSDEFQKWAERAKTLGHGDAASRLEDAAKEMLLVNRSLNDALNLMGGPLKKAK